MLLFASLAEAKSTPRIALFPIANGVNAASYSYLANSPLISQILFNTNGTTRMTTTKKFDLLNRLQSIASAPGTAGVSAVSFNYSDHNANQRTRRTDSDASYWGNCVEIPTGCKSIKV